MCEQEVNFWDSSLFLRICQFDSFVKASYLVVGIIAENPKLFLKVNFYIYLFTAIGLLPGGSGYFTYKQNMQLVTTKFKSGGLHEKHVVATWNVGNHLSICL